MPGLDQTGPKGQGPMTGERRGRCGGRPRCGRGQGTGKYCGRTYLNKDEEVEDLEEDAKNMEADLAALKEKISELKK